jgi:hypothetical protein
MALVVVVPAFALGARKGADDDKARLAPYTPGRPVAPFLATGGLNSFSQHNALNGRITVTHRFAYDGDTALVAWVDRPQSGGYARVVERVNWHANSEVYYAAAFLLPRGYKSRLQGGNDIMRWDNFGRFGRGGDYGGIELWRDGHARLITGHYLNDPRRVLVGPFDVPEGRWFWLEVRERFSTRRGEALSEVRVDGRLVGRSREPNVFGRRIDRVRWGEVAVQAGRQRLPLHLYLDRVSIATRSLPPLR